MKGSAESISLIPISLCFLFLFRDEFVVPARHLCRPEQREAILELKNKFQIQEPCSDRTLSWVNNSDCCSWDGIRCDATFGDVIELNLASNCIDGQLNSKSTILSLQSLPLLVTLDLSGNHFSGKVPSSLGNLSQLATLDLSNNAFNGEIPSSLGNLLHLTSLSLGGNNFVGGIPWSLGNLTNLTSLYLSHNNFLGKIPSSLGNLSHLTDLSIGENEFSGEIPSSFGNFSHLDYIDLSQNSFIGEIPSSFGRLKHLIVLFAEDNNLSGNFPVTLLNLTKLLDLSLHDNKFTGILPPNISSLSNLRMFYVSSNGFTGTLPSSLFSIHSLTHAYLEDNQLNGTLEFGNVSSSSNLKELSLGKNNFMGSIPRSISKLVNLTIFDLSHPNTQGLVLDLSIFWNLKSLDILDLSGNHVRYEKRNSMSHPLLLGELYLSGCGITEFPEFLRTTHDMAVLDISNNKIKGKVPGWLWELSTLQNLALSNNTFASFESPTNLRQPSLKYLFGANNNFTGRIPSFICELQYLTVLDLSNNRFNGPFPRCIGKLSSILEALHLRQNRLSGRLPEIIISRALKSFDIGHNRLVGKLPRSLLASSLLEVLNVESNRFDDTFPSWLSSLPELQVLVLRSNAFHGPIHQTRFSKLRIIDISHNRFNGTLPSDFFVNWTTMCSIGKDVIQSNGKYMGTSYYFDSMVLMSKGVEMEFVRILYIYTALDLSENEFEEVIPSSIGLLKDLHVLNLSGNAFIGHIPSSMGNLSSLESLDLSRNKLTGGIPQELGNLSYLAVMNFSHNQLVGLVPGGTQFRTQPCSSFKDNPGLYGPSLDEACLDIHRKSSHQSEASKEEGGQEVISWIAAAIGFIPGIAFGFTMGYIVVSYKPEWFVYKLFWSN